MSARGPSSELPPSEIAVSDKVPIGQKIAYGLGTFHDMWGHWLYNTIAFQVFNIFLGVAPWLVGIALFFNRIFDGISDPLFGWLSDNTRTRWGRRRPYILVAGVLGGLMFPLLVAVTPGWGSTTLFGKEVSNYLWFMLASSAIYLPVMSAFKVPFDCLGAEMTPDYNERTSVWSFRGAIQKLPELGMFFAAQFMTMAVWIGATNQNVAERVKLLFTSTAAWAAAPMGEKPNVLIGAQVYLTVLGLLMATAAVVMFFVVRERYYHKVAGGKQEKIRFAETLWLTLKCRPFRMQLLMKLPYAMGTSMVGALGYYDTVYYVSAGNVSEGAVWNFRMGIAGMVFGIIGIPTFATLSRVIGKRRAVIWILLAAMAVFVGTWWLYNPRLQWLQIFATGLIAFTSAGFWMMDGSIRADVIDYDELQTGKRREGAFTACDSWISKVGQALGAGASGIILSLTGFDAALGGAQSEKSLFLIRFLLAAVPIAGISVALIMAFLFPLTPSKMAEIRKQLELRRGTV